MGDTSLMAQGQLVASNTPRSLVSIATPSFSASMTETRHASVAKCAMVETHTNAGNHEWIFILMILSGFLFFSVPKMVWQFVFCALSPDSCSVLEKTSPLYRCAAVRPLCSPIPKHSCTQQLSGVIAWKTQRKPHHFERGKEEKARKCHQYEDTCSS
jgi:hypothetical protein